MKAKLILIVLLSSLLFSCTEDMLPVEEPIEDVKSFEEQFLELVNEVRVEGITFEDVYLPPVAPLVLDEKLNEASLLHCEYMSEHGICHTWEDGTNVIDRATIYNFMGSNYWQHVSETDVETPKELLELWLSQLCYCEMLMDERVTVIGIAEKNDYWCNILAKKFGS